MPVRRLCLLFFFFPLLLTSCSMLPQGSSRVVYSPSTTFQDYADAAVLAPDGKGLLVVFQSAYNRVNVTEFLGSNQSIIQNKSFTYAVPNASGNKIARIAPDGMLYVLVQNPDLTLLRIPTWSRHPESGGAYKRLIQFLPPGVFGGNSTMAIGNDGKIWIVAQMPAPSMWSALYEVDPSTLSVIKGPIPLGRQPLGGNSLVASTRSGDLWITIGLAGNYGQTINAVAFVARTGVVLGRYPVASTFTPTNIRTIDGKGVEIAEQSRGCFTTAIEPPDEYLGSIFYIALMKSLGKAENDAMRVLLFHQNPTSPLFIASLIGTYARNLYSAEEHVNLNKVQDKQVRKFIAQKGLSRQAAHNLYQRIMENLSSGGYGGDKIGTLNSTEICRYGQNDPEVSYDLGVIGWLKGHGYWSLTAKSIFLQRNGYSQFLLVRRIPVSRSQEGILEKLDSYMGTQSINETGVYVRNQASFLSRIYPVGRNRAWVFDHKMVTFVHLSNQVAHTPSPFEGL